MLSGTFFRSYANRLINRLLFFQTSWDGEINLFRSCDVTLIYIFFNVYLSIKAGLMRASVNKHRKHFAMCYFLSQYKRSWFGKFLPVKWLNTFQTAHWQSQTNQYLQGTSPPSWPEAPAVTMAPWSRGGYTNFRGKTKKNPPRQEVLLAAASPCPPPTFSFLCGAVGSTLGALRPSWGLCLISVCHYNQGHAHAHS